MPEELRALILGIVQGLTEFLPVSSSGHLEIAKVLLPQKTITEEGLLMTVVLHFATALSTVFIFRNDLIKIFKGLFEFKRNSEFRFSVSIILSMVPAAFVGVFFDDLIESFFNGNILLVGTMLILTGLLLFLADKAKNTNKEVSYVHAIIIGISQAIAILPGISRSGATISTSVLLGIDREKAARFSFLMVVPLIFGKIAKDILSDDFNLDKIQMTSLGIGFIAAFLTGLFACKLMIKLVKQSRLIYFAIYCIIVGVISIILTTT